MIQFAPHTIYEELWHITFWQHVTLDWVNGIETPFPAHPSAGFPQSAMPRRALGSITATLLPGLQQVAAVAGERKIGATCSLSLWPGNPVRIMTVREQLESLAAHNAYHFGRIVLLRQLSRAWPPPSGGFSW